MLLSLPPEIELASELTMTLSCLGTKEKGGKTNQMKVRNNADQEQKRKRKDKDKKYLSTRDYRHGTPDAVRLHTGDISTW
jgi:hypothetical protein